jgi:hypothetical protein
VNGAPSRAVSCKVRRMSDPLRKLFPDMYGPFLPAFFDQPRPREQKATCHDCVMCPKGAAAPSDDVAYFRPDVKCCTYHPRVPNYHVGGLLADMGPEMAEGRRRMQERIRSRISVTPHNVSPPRKLEVLRMASWRNTMGRSLLLRCPFYAVESGGCTVWKYREIECTTFFCKHDAGADGEAFWKAIRAYMVHVERELAEAAVQAIMPEYEDQPSAGMTLEDLEDRAPEPKTYSALWQGWEGREEEFYMACHEHVSSLARERYEAIVRGEALDGLTAALAATYGAVMSPVLPERLVPNPEMGAKVVETGVLVKTYSRYEPLLLTEALHEVIRELRADETVAEMRERLNREAGVDVPEALLLALYQMRVLVVPA